MNTAEENLSASDFPALWVLKNLYRNKINEICSISRRYLNFTHDQSSLR